MIVSKVWQPWLPRDRCTVLSTKWEERDREPADVLKDPPMPAAVGSGRFVCSGTVCSPITQWDLGNNSKPQVLRIWVLLANVKIVALVFPAPPPAPPNTHPNTTIWFMLMVLTRHRAIGKKNRFSKAVVFSEIISDWKHTVFFRKRFKKKNRYFQWDL
jgi:hypothetical protein